MNLRTLALAAIASLALAASGAAGAASVSTCAQFGTVAIAGGTYTYQQNEWNSSATQCASVDDVSGAFTLTSASFNLATNGAPATYPSIYRGCHWGACTTSSGLPIQVSNLGSATTSWSTTQPASGAYDVAYDIWTNTTPTTTGQPNGSEIMIWLNSRRGVQPFGSQVATGVSIAGKTWNVWTGRQSSWNIVSYVLTPGATSFTNLDVRALVQDSVARGSTNASWYLIDAEAGFEIWQGGQGLASNSFSFSATAGGGGGDTQAPSTPGGLRVTGTTASSVSLAWNPSTDNVGVTGYDVLRNGAPVATIAGTSYTDAGRSASTTYSYTVRARDAAGNVSSQSAPASATTQAGGGGSGGTLKVQYRNNDTAPGDNQIKPGLQLVNTGTGAVSLSGITIRYWFTRDAGASTFSTWCDYAVIGCGNFTRSVAAVSPARANADSYLQVVFTGGTLAAGASTGEMQIRFNKTDWSPFTETNDYSYGTATGSFADAARVTVYQNGVLIWGTEPA